MRSLDRRQLLAVLVAVMCAAALPGSTAAAGGGEVRMPSNHTDFGTGDEPEPTVLENFSVGGSGDSASISGPVGGATKGGGLVSSGDTISWSESSPSTSESVINVTGETNTEWSNVTYGSAADGSMIDVPVGGTTPPDHGDGEDPLVILGGNTGWSGSDSWQSDPNLQSTSSSGSLTIPSEAGTVDVTFIGEDDIGAGGDSGSIELFVDGSSQGSKSASSGSASWTVSLDPGSHSFEFQATEDMYLTKWEYNKSGYTQDPSVTFDTGETVSLSGDLGEGETHSQRVDLSTSTSSATVSTSSGEVDVIVEKRETTETVDPVVEVNGDAGQQVAIDGTLADGETVFKEITNAWLENDNTATVTLNDSNLAAGSPSMEARVSAEMPAETARYVSAPYDTLSTSSGVGLDWRGSATLDVTVQGWDGSSWVDARDLSTSETGEVTLNYEPIDYERTRIEIVADDDVQIEEESLLFSTYEPEIDASSATPSDGSGVTGPPVELSVDVSDRDFGALQSDTVEVEFFDASDDTSFGSETLTSDGTVTETFDNPVAGSNSWYVVATDSHGNVVESETFEFATPDVLELRNESAPGQLVTEQSDIEVRFFGQESGEVITRTATDGTIDMTGLPVDEPLIASTDVDGYFQRSIAIDSILEQQRMFLLPESADASQVDWVLDDNSGRFDPGSTTLFIERPIEIDGETKYRTVYGEQFGGTGRTASTLATGDRYRLRVENQDGNTRLLGSYLAAGAAQETLTVGSVDFPGLDDTGTAFSAVLDEGDGVIDYRFADDETETDELTIEVYKNGELVQNATLTGPIQTVREQIPLSEMNHSEGDSYRIEYTAQRNGIAINGERIVGDVPEIADEWNIDPGLLNVLGMITVMASFGAVVILSPRHAGLVASSVAFGLSLIGVVAMNQVLIAFAFVVSGVFAAAGGNP